MTHANARITTTAAKPPKTHLTIRINFPHPYKSAIPSAEKLVPKPIEPTIFGQILLKCDLSSRSCAG
jgi:hypothetical protein